MHTSQFPHQSAIRTMCLRTDVFRLRTSRCLCMSVHKCLLVCVDVCTEFVFALYAEHRALLYYQNGNKNNQHRIWRRFLNLSIWVNCTDDVHSRHQNLNKHLYHLKLIHLRFLLLFIHLSDFRYRELLCKVELTKIPQTL